MGVFADFQKEKNLPDAQLTGVSRMLERLSPADRELLRKRQAARKAEKKYSEENLSKPKSGRGITVQALGKARADQPLPRKIRSKIAKAVNTILQRRGQEQVKIDQIFGKVGVAKGKVQEKK
jgi:hypothetical protein